MTTRSGFVDVSHDGDRRTITLDRPAKANALTGAMLADLTELFSAPGPGDERVTVLTATGSVFSAGLDLGELRAGGPGRPRIDPLLEAVEAYPSPVVAMVQGHALAGGVELALHCDFVVAEVAATFGMPLARQGLVLSWPLTVKLVSILGAPLARRLLLAGERLPAPVLADVHAIYDAVDAAALAGRVDALAASLAEGEPAAVRAFKLTVARITTLDSRSTEPEIEKLLADVKGHAATAGAADPQAQGAEAR